MVDPEKKPSVRKKLEDCRVIAAEKQASKELMRELEKFAPPKKIDPR